MLPEVVNKQRQQLIGCDCCSVMVDETEPNQTAQPYNYIILVLFIIMVHVNSISIRIIIITRDVVVVVGEGKERGISGEQRLFHYFSH